MKKLNMLLLVLVSSFSFAQIAMGSGSANGKWTYGGGLGFGFGNNSYFSIGVSPRVGYKLMDNLEVGAQGSLNFQSSDSYKSTMIGVGPFANYYIANNFYVGGLMQHYFINFKDKFYDYKANTDETALYLGGGYLQRIGNNSAMQIGIMYNVLWKENNSIFSSGLAPSIGFVVGI